jgi:hypothetical protein
MVAQQAAVQPVTADSNGTERAESSGNVATRPRGITRIRSLDIAYIRYSIQ